MPAIQIQIRTAYAFDWNKRDASGQLHPLADQWWANASSSTATTMSDHKKCGLTVVYNYDWKGLIASTANADPDTQQIQTATDGDLYGEFSADRISAILNVATGTLPANTGPRHAINGTMGCVPDTTPTGCVLILPIVAPNDSRPPNIVTLAGVNR